MARAWHAGLLFLLAGCATMHTNHDEKAARVDALMQAYAGHAPGASVLVLEHGHAVLRRSYGLADVEHQVAATPQTHYRLASVTKQFTAAAILLLAERGALSIDDPVRKWLPTLPHAADTVTLRHLLTHSSGLVDYEDVMPEMPDGAQLRDADVLALLEGQDRTYFAPGTSYRYSNSGYALLALVVERVSGQSFQAFLLANVFQPLGMQALAYVQDGPAVPHRAYGYSLVDGRWTRTDQSSTSAVLGDGGVYASIDDLARWDAAMADDRLLSDASRTAATTPWVATDDPAVRYGFGWRISGDMVWHSGETIGFRNVILRWPGERLTVVVLTNRDDPEPYALAMQVAQAWRGTDARPR